MTIVAPKAPAKVTSLRQLFENYLQYRTRSTNHYVGFPNPVVENYLPKSDSICGISERTLLDEERMCVTIALCFWSLAH